MSEEFNKKITKDFGLEGMDSREQERMIEKIGNLLFESVVERAVDEMNEDTMTDFEDVVANAGEDYQKVISFMKSKVTGFDKIVSEEMSRLKKGYFGDICLI